MARKQKKMLNLPRNQAHIWSIITPSPKQSSNCHWSVLLMRKKKCVYCMKCVLMAVVQPSLSSRASSSRSVSANGASQCEWMNEWMTTMQCRINELVTDHLPPTEHTNTLSLSFHYPSLTLSALGSVRTPDTVISLFSRVNSMCYPPNMCYYLSSALIIKVRNTRVLYHRHHLPYQNRYLILIMLMTNTAVNLAQYNETSNSTFSSNSKLKRAPILYIGICNWLEGVGAHGIFFPFFSISESLAYSTEKKAK